MEIALWLEGYLKEWERFFASQKLCFLRKLRFSFAEADALASQKLCLHFVKTLF